MSSTNGGRRYCVTSFLIGWAHTLIPETAVSWTIRHHHSMIGPFNFNHSKLILQIPQPLRTYCWILKHHDQYTLDSIVCKCCNYIWNNDLSFSVEQSVFTVVTECFRRKTLQILTILLQLSGWRDSIYFLNRAQSGGQTKQKYAAQIL